MHITFLIGNGFDRALGLNTDYASFLDYYLQTESSSKNIEEFKKRIKEERGEWQPSDGNDIASSEGKWSDCELAKGHDTQNFETAEEYHECWDDFYTHLVQYLIAQALVIGDDAIKQFANEFAISLSDFPHTLGDVDRNRILKHPAYHSNNNIQYNFICFNYTENVDAFCHTLKNEAIGTWQLSNGATRRGSIGALAHPHGCISKGDIIFGVNDVSQVANQVLLEDDSVRCDVIKHDSNAICKSYQEQDAQSLIDESNIIYIFGMSLGETDKQWWEQIGNWLCTNDSNLLIIQQHKEISHLEPRHRLYTAERKVKERFVKLTDLDEEEAAEVENRIIVSFQPNMFDFVRA